MKKLIVFSLALVLMLTVAYGEDGARPPVQGNGPPVEQVQDNKELTAIEIAEFYKNILVDVQTIITREDGRVEAWGGSGFFVDKQGTILTCAHVVYDDSTEVTGMFGVTIKVAPVARYDYWITLNKRKYKATMIGANKYKDVAVLKVIDVDPAAYNVAKLGNSDATKVGEKVYAYGNPMDLPGTFTSGSVSAVHRQITGADNLWYLQDFIQTDTPINPGNSGGPLINSRGEVVGINAGTYHRDGLHLAISINLANVPKLMKDGIVKMGYFGSEVMLDNFARTGVPGAPGMKDVIELYNLTDLEDLESVKLLANTTYPNADNTERRSIVLTVDQNSPAELAGLRRGDLITTFNGSGVKDGRDIRLLLMDIEPEKEFEIKVLRIEKGAVKELTLKVTLMKEKPKN